MSEKSVCDALKKTGHPVNLLGSHETRLPRISYAMPDENVLYADDARYAAFDQCEVRLYTDRYPDAEAEASVEECLENAGYGSFSKARNPISSERLHETTYMFTDTKGRTEDVEEEEK